MRRRYSRPDRGRRGTVVGCRGERRRGLPQRPAQPAAASRAETHLRAVAGFVADVGMQEPLVWFAPDSLLEGGGFEPPVPRQRRHPSATANHLSEPCRPVFKIELKPRRSAMTLSLPAKRCTGPVILGLDRLTRHAAQMDREPELKIIRRAFAKQVMAAWWHQEPSGRGGLRRGGAGRLPRARAVAD